MAGDLDLQAELSHIRQQLSMAADLDVPAELTSIRQHLAALQSSVDGNVLEAFRRLRQQTSDVSLKVDELMADRIAALNAEQSKPLSPVPEGDLGSYDTSASSPRPKLAEIPQGFFRELEARIPAILVQHVNSLGLATMPDVERISERLRAAESIITELACKPMEPCASGDPEVTQARESTDYIDTKMCLEVISRCTTLDNRLEGLEAQVRSIKVETDAGLNFVSEELLHMGSCIFKTVDGLNTYDALSAGTLQEPPPVQAPPASDGSLCLDAQQLNSALQAENELVFVDRSGASIPAAIVANRGIGVVESPVRKGANSSSQPARLEPTAVIEEVAAAQQAVKHLLSRHLGEPFVTYRQSPSSPLGSQHSPQNEQSGGSAKELADVAARNALATLRRQLQDQSIDTNSELNASAEDAVAVAVTIARAMLSPSSSCNSVRGADSQRISQRSCVMALPEEPSEEGDASHQAPASRWGSYSPFLRGLRASQSQGQLLPASQSPFNKQHRDQLPRFGGSDLTNWVPEAVRRRNREAAAAAPTKQSNTSPPRRRSPPKGIAQRPASPSQAAAKAVPAPSTRPRTPGPAASTRPRTPPRSTQDGRAGGNGFSEARRSHTPPAGASDGFASPAMRRGSPSRSDASRSDTSKWNRY